MFETLAKGFRQARNRLAGSFQPKKPPGKFDGLLAQ